MQCAAGYQTALFSKWYLSGGFDMEVIRPMRFRQMTAHKESIRSARTRPARGGNQGRPEVACFENTSWVMFDLNEDPYQQMNLTHNNIDRTERQKFIARLKQ